MLSFSWIYYAKCKSESFYQSLVIAFVLCCTDACQASNDAFASSVGPDGSTFREYASWPGYQTAAFVDLNADRRVDLILLNATGNEVFGLIEPDAKQSAKTAARGDAAEVPQPQLLLTTSFPNPIRSVVAADFNGDSRPDLLLLVGSSTTGPFDAYISFVQLEGSSRKFAQPVQMAKFSAQPLVGDFNSDMISDIFGETPDSRRLLLLGGSTLSNVSTAYTGPAWSKLGYSAFADVNGDNFPDVVVLVENSGRYQLQILIRSPNLLGTVPTSSATSYADLPASLGTAHSSLTLGLFTIADFSQTGRAELLLPVCASTNCKGSSSFHLYDFLASEWSAVQVNWSPNGLSSTSASEWSLAVTPSVSTGLAVSALVGPSIGDVNLDGRVDVLVGLTYWSSSGQTRNPTDVLPALLINNGMNSKGTLTLSAFLLPGAKLYAQPNQLRQVAFFDQDEDATLDVLTVLSSSNQIPSTKLFVQVNARDPYFLKVVVLDGKCASAESCSDGRLPYGLFVPGVMSSYNTEAPDGQRQVARAPICSQSCCGALQLPFVVFGLGYFANYVEHMAITIPYTEKVVRTRVLSFMVPKSQIVINPYPHDRPDSWTTKLFLQPLYNMKVLYIAITLLCVCLLLIIIISILQWLEVREDRSERQQESQRFHFDAM